MSSHNNFIPQWVVKQCDISSQKNHSASLRADISRGLTSHRGLSYHWHCETPNTIYFVFSTFQTYHIYVQLPYLFAVNTVLSVCSIFKMGLFKFNFSLRSKLCTAKTFSLLGSMEQHLMSLHNNCIPCWVGPGGPRADISLLTVIQVTYRYPFLE